MTTLGIDFDSYALHVCALGNGPPEVVSVALRKKGDDEHRAFTMVASALGAAVTQICAGFVQDVWIERGYGASRRADFVLGGIYGATFVAVRHVLPTAAARPLLAGDWKRDLTGEMGITTKTGGRGNGNVKKDIANDCARQLWQREWPGTAPPSDPNQLDAFSIAWAGSRL